MNDKTTAIPVPDNWDDLTDEEKDAATADILKRLADQTGVRRGAPSAKTGGGTGSSQTRSFRKPT